MSELAAIMVLSERCGESAYARMVYPFPSRMCKARLSRSFPRRYSYKLLEGCATEANRIGTLFMRSAHRESGREVLHENDSSRAGFCHLLFPRPETSAVRIGCLAA